MTKAQIVAELMSLLFCEAEATGDGDDSVGQVEGQAGEVIETEHAALPGFSSGVTASDRLLIIRRHGKAVSVAALNTAPGETPGDRTVWTGDGLVLRLRGKVLEVTGSEVVDGIKLDGAVKVARDTDPVTPAAGMVIWMGQVAAALNALVPGSVTPAAPPDFGTIVASTKKVLAG